MTNRLPASVLLQLLVDGRLFKLAFTWILRACAAATALAAVWFSIELWRGGNNSTQAVFGQLVFQAALILAAYMVAHLSWLRAQDVALMPQTGGEVILPLSRLLLRLAGELYASLMAVLGLGGALMIWISAGEARLDVAELRMLLSSFGGEPFPAGLTMLLVGFVCGALGLLAGYAASELIGVLCAIESNTKNIRQD